MGKPEPRKQITMMISLAIVAMFAQTAFGMKNDKAITLQVRIWRIINDECVSMDQQEICWGPNEPVGDLRKFLVENCGYNKNLTYTLSTYTMNTAYAVVNLPLVEIPVGIIKILHIHFPRTQ